MQPKTSSQNDEEEKKRRHRQTDEENEDAEVKLVKNMYKYNTTYNGKRGSFLLMKLK